MGHLYMHNLVEQIYQNPEVHHLRDIANNYNCTLEIIPEHKKDEAGDGNELIFSNYITGFATIGYENKTGLRRSLLSGFPGNCGLLILSNIQDKYENGGTAKKYFKDILDTAIEVGGDMGYARLLITGTSPFMYKYLIEKYGFKCIDGEIFNPHSDNKNHILSLDITKDIDADEDE